MGKKEKYQTGKKEEKRGRKEAQVYPVAISLIRRKPSRSTICAFARGL